MSTPRTIQVDKPFELTALTAELEAAGVPVERVVPRPGNLIIDVVFRDGSPSGHYDAVVDAIWAAHVKVDPPVDLPAVCPKCGAYNPTWIDQGVQRQRNGSDMHLYRCGECEAFTVKYPIEA